MTGADDGFEQFAAAHGDGMFRFAYLLCRDYARAEDFTQEALLKAYRRWDVVRSLDSPVAYVRRIVVTEYLGWRRRLPSREIAGISDVTQVDEPGYAKILDREQLWRLMGRLSPMQRAVLVLRYYEDLDDVTIAAVLGCSRGAVRSTASRAINAIKVSLDKSEGSCHEQHRR